MSTTPTETILVPPPAQIKERLAATVAEARSLRKLLKLSEAAYRVREAAASRREVRSTDGGREAAPA